MFAERRSRWMRPAVAYALGAALGLLSSISIPGCSLIGFTGGAVSDMVEGKGHASRLLRVRSGVRITLWLVDGRKGNGVFEGAFARDAASETEPVTPSNGADATRSGDVAGGAEGRASMPFDVVISYRDGVLDTIPAENIRRVSVPVARGKVIGTLVGVTIDALVVAAVAASLDNSSGCSYSPSPGLYGDFVPADSVTYQITAAGAHDR
jgi:hypothetical protein